MNKAAPQFFVKTDGDGRTRRIAYRLDPPRSGKPLLVWFPGFKSDMRSTKATALADFAAREGYGCLRFDYSGHGESEGAFEDGTVSQWLDEARDAVGLALDQNPAPTVFVGSSMGAWIALLLARVLKPAGMVLIAPAWDMTRLMLERATPEARETLAREGRYLRPSAYDTEPYVITRALILDGENHLLGGSPIPLDVPIRILHGLRDTDVPWERSLELLNLLAGEDVRLTLVKDGEHRLSRPQDLDLLFSLVSEVAAHASASSAIARNPSL